MANSISFADLFILVYTVCLCVYILWQPFLRRRPSHQLAKNIIESSGQVYPCKLYYIYDKWVSYLSHWCCLIAPSYNFPNPLQTHIPCHWIDMSTLHIATENFCKMSLWEFTILRSHMMTESNFWQTDPTWTCYKSV